MLEHNYFWWRKEVFKSKQYVTARDEYLNINDYSIKNTNIFINDSNNNFFVDKNIKIVFKNIMKNNNLENICFDNLIKILENENCMLLSKEIRNELIAGEEEVKINEDPPISEEKILKFFKDFT